MILTDLLMSAVLLTALNTADDCWLSIVLTYTVGNLPLYGLIMMTDPFSWTDCSEYNYYHFIKINQLHLTALG